VVVLTALHVHREQPLRSILLEAGRRLAIPVRDLAPGLVYRGDFYGQTAKGEPLPDAIAVDALLGLLSSLPLGVTELGCHPAADPEAASSYAAERVEELRVLRYSRRSRGSSRRNRASILRRPHRGTRR
jgi:hypothetical protein